MDFHRTEDLLVTVGDDDVINVYNTQTGTHQKKIVSKKYGARNVCWTHHPAAILHASNRSGDHALRYLSLYDNQYLRYFKGHTGSITSLCMAPKNDLFMSAAQVLSSLCCKPFLHACLFGVRVLPCVLCTCS